jgi:hypothetical protein
MRLDNLRGDSGGSPPCPAGMERAPLVAALSDAQYAPVQHPNWRVRVLSTHGRASLQSFLEEEASFAATDSRAAIESPGATRVPGVACSASATSMSHTSFSADTDGHSVGLSAFNSDSAASPSLSIFTKRLSALELERVRDIIGSVPKACVTCAGAISSNTTSCRITYSQQVSPAANTTAILAKPAWFGASLAHATQQSPAAFVFDKELRAVMETHIEKARKMRLIRLCKSAEAPDIDAVVRTLMRKLPNTATIFHKDSVAYDPDLFPLASTLAHALGLPVEVGLASAHFVLIDTAAKDAAMSRLVDPTLRSPFHAAYDEFCASVVAPNAGAAACCSSVWVQVGAKVKVNREH